MHLFPAQQRLSIFREQILRLEKRSGKNERKKKREFKNGLDSATKYFSLRSIGRAARGRRWGKAPT